ncbi:hypothetical protein SynBIOSE41_00858 [Synechococcus sp. BIOS-E4-1]|uniref:hypothetical protein n=1 Tax=Synechococcus sp. BIOS-E4-1 TaxID=1400864 RepID=UPI001645E02A|nr:hypothetical protein [Synechococcus sp. BIOS-E4-1]QNI53390.1 hypothetical protein SynBIOSE41_00858 [Synechococcus sp. BIOS-E4-1]
MPVPTPQELNFIERINPFGGARRQQLINDYAAAEQIRRQNERVQGREDVMEYLPEFMKSDATRNVIDAVGDAQAQVRAIPRGAYLAAGITGTAGAVAALNAANQLMNEGYEPTPFRVASRSTGNFIDGITGGIAGGLGLDPLAKARANVQQMNESIGSPAVVRALVDDEVRAAEEAQSLEFRAQQRAIDQGPANTFDSQVADLVNNRAQELMATPIQQSDGSVAPMDFDTAIRLAQQEVGMQLRAEGIL